MTDSHTAMIPEDVVSALQAVERELREDVIDPETVAIFMHLLGFDPAREWLGAHPALYFEALRRCHMEQPAATAGRLF
jgi:hypothetical protein